MLEDLDSVNKTYLNEKEVFKAEIKTGDRIGIANFTIELDLEDKGSSEKPISLEDTLTKTSYGLKWKNYPDTFDGLIQMYYEDLFSSYDTIIKMLSGPKEKLVRHLYQKYELENLKAVLRLVCNNQSNKKLIQKTTYLLPHKKKASSFSFQALLEAKDMTEFTNLLSGTWYFEPLKNSLYRFAAEKETFPLEISLDLSYYNRLWRYIQSLSCQDRKIAQRILGVQFDILNIFWIFRFKKMYHFSPEEILNYSLMHGIHLSASIRLKLAYSSDYNDMIHNLTGTPYKKLLGYGNDPEIDYTKLVCYKLSLAKRNWQRCPFQIGTVLDYLLFKETEIKDLISITEANRLCLSYERIKDYLLFNCRLEKEETNN